jgi:hypothetical protein
LTLTNSDGRHTVPSSSANTLQIGPFLWTGVPVAVADNMTHREDGLVGNSLFTDKVIEIDYDRQVIVVHSERPILSEGWTREDVVLDGGTVPFVRGTLTIGDEARHGWFMLDTGAYTSILNSDRLSAVSKFADEFGRLFGPFGAPRPGPAMAVGGRTFSATNYSVRPYDGQSATLGLLGNDILKRFNVLLDNRAGAVYFRPNRHIGDGFRNPERVVVRGVLVALGLVVGAVVARRARRRTFAGRR